MYLYIHIHLYYPGLTGLLGSEVSFRPIYSYLYIQHTIYWAETRNLQARLCTLTVKKNIPGK